MEGRTVLLKKLLENGNTFAVNRMLIQITDSWTKAAFLSQVIYWENKMNGEFWKTDQKNENYNQNGWSEELLIPVRTVQRIRSDLVKQNLIIVTPRGIPKKNYYKINWDILIEELNRIIENENSSAVEVQPTSTETPNSHNNTRHNCVAIDAKLANKETQERRNSTSHNGATTGANPASLLTEITTEITTENIYSEEESSESPPFDLKPKIPKTKREFNLSYWNSFFVKYKDYYISKYNNLSYELSIDYITGFFKKQPILARSCRFVPDWPEVFYRIIEKDKRQPSELKKIMKWLHYADDDKNSDFWSEQIQSPAKMRKRNSDSILYYDVLLEKTMDYLTKNGGRDSPAVDEQKQLRKIFFDKWLQIFDREVLEEVEINIINDDAKDFFNEKFKQIKNKEPEKGEQYKQMVNEYYEYRRKKMNLQRNK